MKKITILILCLPLLMVGSMLAQETVWVAAVAAGAGNGTSEANAYGSFATALADINSTGDVLRVVGTVPSGSHNLSLTSDTAPSGNKNFQYTIEGDATGSTLTGTDGLTRMFTINNPSVGQDVTFRNIKFSGSTNFPSGGGAVLLTNQAGVSVTFENCRFEGNSLASTVTTGGGALSIANSSVTITDCLFKENQALRNGGALFINSANVNISKTTFYKNSTTDTASAFGGGALFINGTATVTLDYCTFFQNNIGHANQDYGTIRTESTGNGTTITNSLFYDNKVNNGIGAVSDWGAAPSGTQTFNKSIGQWITNNIDTRTNFISFVKTGPDPLAAANLTSSTLVYDDASGKVKYTDATPGDHSPISFGADGKDAGAWNSPNTWKGTTSSDWADATNWSVKGIPGATKEALIVAATNQPVIASPASVKSLTLNASTTLNISSGSLTVAEAIVNNGSLTIANGANLRQTAVANTNSGSGTATVNRSSAALKRLDYTMWSSPVSGAQTLEGFSPNTSRTPNRFYTYNGGTAFATIATTSTFEAGKGYLIRMPNDAANDATAFAGQFTGTLNNGTITVSGLASDNYYSVGNPYPSTISATEFLNSNPGTLYFWRKTNGAVGGAYATFNNVGAAASGAGSETPNGTIQVGQGFIAKTGVAADQLVFTNDMRLGTTSTQFFKTKNTAVKSRVWLDLTATGGLFSQALIGYLDGATLGVDNGYDGKYLSDSATDAALTSIVDGGEYTIQGRPAFDVSDVVALGFKTGTAGDYTIAINKKDGALATQDVYLVDSKTGIETDLNAGSYTFNAAVGTDNTRFSLKYQKTLKVIDATLDNNSVSVYQNNGAIYINSKSASIRSVKVFDVQGRLIAEQRNVNANTAVFSNLRAKNQLLIVNVIGEDNSEVSKKVMN